MDDPGAVLVGPALGHLSFAEGIGAYHAAAAPLIALGLSGWVRRAMEAVPALVCFLVTAADVQILRIGAGAWCSAPSPRRGCWNENRNAAR